MRSIRVWLIAFITSPLCPLSHISNFPINPSHERNLNCPSIHPSQWISCVWWRPWKLGIFKMRPVPFQNLPSNVNIRQILKVLLYLWHSVCCCLVGFFCLVLFFFVNVVQNQAAFKIDGPVAECFPFIQLSFSPAAFTECTGLSVSSRRAQGPQFVNSHNARVDLLPATFTLKAFWFRWKQSQKNKSTQESRKLVLQKEHYWIYEGAQRAFVKGEQNMLSNRAKPSQRLRSCLNDL